jgi:hypothetical protein
MIAGTTKDPNGFYRPYGALTNFQQIGKTLLTSVHFDPVITHFRTDAHAVVGGEDDVGDLVREVAVDAFAFESTAAPGEEAAAFHFVAGEAASGKIYNVALRQVNVVTRRAGHVRRLEAFAALQ